MESKPDWLVCFGNIWQQLDTSNMDSIDKLYHPEIIFQDPCGTINGRDQLKQHMAELYRNVSAISYELMEPIGSSQSTAAQPWVMTFRHPKLNSGNNISVNGVSILKTQNGLIISHRDYFDMGEMIYESIPILGRVVTHLKHKLAP
ncbi:nuclear transport factor 2 family protein [Ferrimonas lipolytica]|uniref:Nuclear transport factor 2 family protein n=1 Tax=Ferrimonas lipolytica TaxID=2724191 RepID=A0A6H1UES7_9GAMM|nr:nuclear transport factor 2 family protein [Ferrimonas lipolytica]QIZ76843.1 nuclear transport factor 2 family protein [Ferrimonas lipolytica]